MLPHNSTDHILAYFEALSEFIRMQAIAIAFDVLNTLAFNFSYTFRTKTDVIRSSHKPSVLIQTFSPFFVLALRRIQECPDNLEIEKDGIPP